MYENDNLSGEMLSGQSETETGTAARMKVSDKAAEVKEKVMDFGRKAIDGIDDSREGAAGALDRTASTLHSSGEQLSVAAHTAATKLQATAD